MTAPINEIERKAAEWAAKMDDGSSFTDQQPELEAWLNEDPRHLGAYLRVRAALAKVERLGAAAQRLNERQARHPVLLNTLLHNRRRFVVAGALAASFAAIAIFAAAWDANTYDAAYETAVGQTRVASLPDGSSMVLNTDTQVAVHYSLFARDIALNRGEVLFDVAKNKRRPFVVKAANIQARAVGTSFAVNNLVGRPYRITVREGAVEVSSPRILNAVTVSAGSRAIGQADGLFVIESLTPAQVAHDLDWLEGRIFFRHQTLASAAKEFERYSKLRIVIDDPAVAGRTVTGTYIATDPAGFAKGVAAFLGLEVKSSGNTLHLSQKGR
jgi:transmembrane sensor